MARYADAARSGWLLLPMGSMVQYDWPCLDSSTVMMAASGQHPRGHQEPARVPKYSLIVRAPTIPGDNP